MPAGEHTFIHYPLLSPEAVLTMLQNHNLNNRKSNPEHHLPVGLHSLNKRLFPGVNFSSNIPSYFHSISLAEVAISH